MVVYLSPSLYTLVSDQSSGSLRLCCLSFCSYLFQSSCLKRGSDLSKWTFCSARIGRELYTSRQYYQMIALLRSVGAIEVDDSYQVGGRPKQFRLGEPYREGITRFEVHAPRLAKRLAIAAQSKAKDTPLRRWLEECYLERAAFGPEAENVLRNHPYETDYQRACWDYLYSRFAEKSRTYVVAKSGRVTYVPNLVPRQLRHTVLLDGEPAVEVDVSASQPRLAASLYPPGSRELPRFMSLLNAGNVYEVAAGWVGESWSVDRAKEEFFQQVLYGSKAFHGTYPMWGEFAARFPELAVIIERAKGADSSTFPVKLQSIEAGIMLGGVAAELVEQKVPILALHDGFAVKQGDAEAVAASIHQHWTAGTGQRPVIKVGGEIWGGVR